LFGSYFLAMFSIEFNNFQVIKHALRQQAKRRRKNTTIASGHPIAPIPRLVVKTSSLGCHSPVPPAIPKASTMQEVLASIPGFNLKHRKKTARKLSAAAQLEQTKEGLIDLETPDSIFAVLNLSKLLTQETLAQLPLLYQQKLLQLLPEVDRPTSFTGFKYVNITFCCQIINKHFHFQERLYWAQ